MSEVAALAETALALRDGATALSGPTDAVFRQTQVIEAAGLLPPPLAQVAALARARGLLCNEPASLTTETLAEALARSRTPHAPDGERNREPQADQTGGDERHAG
jgi:hypothetical protein